MAYIGRSPQYGVFYKQTITPDGVSTTYNLTTGVASATSMLVSVGGVIQEPESAYTVISSGTQILFTEVINTGVDVFIVFLGEKLIVPVVPDGTISEIKLANSSITTGKLANGAITLEKISNTVVLIPTLNVIASTSVTAVKNNHYVLTNAANTNIVLPPSPTAGDLLWITVGNGLTTNTVYRNSSNIQSLSEDLTLDASYASVQARFINTRLGWMFV